MPEWFFRVAAKMAAGVPACIDDRSSIDKVLLFRRKGSSPEFVAGENQQAYPPASHHSESAGLGSGGEEHGVGLVESRNEVKADLP